MSFKAAMRKKMQAREWLGLTVGGEGLGLATG
jgi:hypothetical protein